MAISSTATIQTSAATLPAGYAPPVLPDLTVDADGLFTVDLPIALADPTPSTGVDNILAALETDFETVQSVELGLDATATINVNVTIVTLTRTNDSSIFSTGTEVYRCACKYEYEKV